MAFGRLAEYWQHRYGVEPLLVEILVDRSRFTGLSLCATNGLRIGASTGRGRLGPDQPVKTLKDIWVYPLAGPHTRRRLQEELPPPLPPTPLGESSAKRLVARLGGPLGRAQDGEPGPRVWG